MEKIIDIDYYDMRVEKVDCRAKYKCQVLLEHDEECCGKEDRCMLIKKINKQKLK